RSRTRRRPPDRPALPRRQKPFAAPGRRCYSSAQFHLEAPVSATTADSTAVSPQELGQRFVIAKLGSFVGLIPLGIWTAFHLWNNLAAFAGAAQWSEAVTHHNNQIGENFGLAAL